MIGWIAAVAFAAMMIGPLWRAPSWRELAKRVGAFLALALIAGVAAQLAWDAAPGFAFQAAFLAGFALKAAAAMGVLGFVIVAARKPAR